MAQVKIDRANVIRVIGNEQTADKVLQTLKSLQYTETGPTLGLTLGLGRDTLVIVTGGLPTLADEKATRQTLKRILGDKVRFSRTRSVAVRTEQYDIYRTAAELDKARKAEKVTAKTTAKTPQPEPQPEPPQTPPSEPQTPPQDTPPAA